MEGGGGDCVSEQGVEKGVAVVAPTRFIFLPLRKWCLIDDTHE